MSRLRIVIVALALQLLCWSPVAWAQVCDFTIETQRKALTAEQFFAQPIGAVALGSICDERSRTCAQYYDFSNCSEVHVPVALSGTASRLFVVFNTMSECRQDCIWVDSILQMGVLYPANADFKPFIDLFRNYSERWGIYRSRPATRLRCCEQTGNLLTPRDYAALEGPGVEEDLLYARTSLAWHSVFQPSNRQTGDGPALFIDWSPAGGQPNRTTWELRNFLFRQLADCPDCSAKLMMTRFQETAVADGVRTPAAPLIQAFNVMTYPRVHIESRAPYADGVYDRSVDIHLER